MTRYAVLWTLLAWLLVHCGSSDSGIYQPGDQISTADLRDAAGDGTRQDIAPADLPELPDASLVELETLSDLYVKILGPSSASSFAVASGEITGAFAPTVSLSGVVVGAFDTLKVVSGTGDFVDVVIPDTLKAGEPYFFTAPPVELLPPVKVGDVYESQFTRVWVEASQGDEVITDLAVVVANPGFNFPSQLNRLPDALFADENSDVVFTLDLNRVDNFDSAQVYLMETDAACKEKIPGSAQLLIDDGNTAESGDELALDRNYTKKVRLDYPDTGIRMFRGSVRAEVNGQTLVAYTPCTPLYIVERFTRASCQTSQDILFQGEEIFAALLQQGWELPDAKKSVIAWLLEVPSVRSAGGTDADALVWVQFQSGMLGALQPAVEESLEETPEWTATDVTIANPVSPTSRAVSGIVTDSQGTWGSFVSAPNCPPLRPLGTLGRLDSLHGLVASGIAFFAARSGLAFGGLNDEERLARGWLPTGGVDGEPAWGGWDNPGAQQLVWSQEPVVCENLTTAASSCFYQPDGTCCVNCSKDPKELCPGAAECITTHSSDGDIPMGFIYDRTHIDLALGRVVLGSQTYGILPSFVQRYAGHRRGPDFAFLGFSNSLTVPQIGLELLGAGADSVVGTTTDVSPEDADLIGTSLFEALVDNQWTPAMGIPKVGDTNPAHPWRLFGGGALNIADSGLLNLDFDSGDLKGWEHTGDARTLAFWCNVEPVQQYMALLSTGIGYTVQTGELRQQFCMKSETLQFQAQYTFISHEFEESCGNDSYLDVFKVFIEDDLGTRQHLATTEKADFIDVNALCPCDAGECAECSQCGSADCECGVLNDPDAGEILTVWPEACAFDTGDAMSSGWRILGPSNVATMGEGTVPVTLVIQVSDRGDSKSDSTILIDSLEFQ